jgi:hypothetical protein
MLVHYQVKPVAFCFGSPVFGEFAVVLNLRREAALQLLYIFECIFVYVV